MTYNTLNTLTPWPALLAQQLDRWQSLMLVTEAEVVLAHHGHAARAFQVKVRLEGDGSCLRSTASESTLEAALLTATHDLEHQIQLRDARFKGGKKSSGKLASG